MPKNKNILYIAGLIIVVILLAIYFSLSDSNKYSGGVDPNIDWQEPTEPPPTEQAGYMITPGDDWVEPTQPPATQ